MSSVIKSIPLTVCGIDLHKQSATSGVIYTLTPARNAVIPLVGQVGNMLIFSVENLASTIATFRGQSRDTGIRFQLPLAPNEIKRVFIPFAEDYILSTTAPLKFSEISTLQTYLPNIQEFDAVDSPSPLFQISSSLSPVYERGVGYKLSGLTNVYLKQSLLKEDFVAISASGHSTVWRLGELRIQSSLDLEYIAPALEVPRTFSVASESTYWISLSTYQRRYVNPAYVAPEAALWRLENIARGD